MNKCPFEKYKDFFGKPGTGVHKYRLLKSAGVDYILSILLAMVLTYFTKVPLVLMTIIVLIVGIILHTLFGVNTETVKYLRLSCN